MELFELSVKFSVQCVNYSVILLWICRCAFLCQFCVALLDFLNKNYVSIRWQNENHYSLTFGFMDAKSVSWLKNWWKANFRLVFGCFEQSSAGSLLKPPASSRTELFSGGRTVKLCSYSGSFFTYLDAISTQYTRT